MENAAKALLIAGEVLIGIIILSIMTFLFLRMGEISEIMNLRIASKKTVIFNTEYNIYETIDNANKDYLTPEEVISLINKVYNWNKSTDDVTEEIHLILYKTEEKNETEIELNGDNLILNEPSLIDYLISYKKYREVLENKDEIISKNTNLSEEDFNNYLEQFKDSKFSCHILYSNETGRVNEIEIIKI